MILYQLNYVEIYLIKKAKLMKILNYNFTSKYYIVKYFINGCLPSK